MTTSQIQLNFSTPLPNSIEEGFVSGLAEHIGQQIGNRKPLSISFIDDRRMTDLNRTYRQIDKTTDVLTFCFDDDEEVWGDIYISLNQVNKNAQEYQTSLHQELSRVMAHAFAHLQGYDHPDEIQSNQMRAYEDKLLEGYEAYMKLNSI